MKGKGQNLTEFGIILGLVVVVCILVYATLGDVIRDMLSKTNVEVENFRPFGVGYNKDTGSRTFDPGELGGTPSTPVNECKGNTCTIDYGDYVLNGLPENFIETVGTNGTSDTNKQLAQILSDLADQLESTSPTGSEALKKLAQTAMLIADLQSQVEDKATYCQGQPNANQCFSDWYSSSTSANMTFPPGYETLLPDMYANPSEMRNIIDMLSYTYPGQASVGYPSIGTDPITTYPGSALREYYSQVQGSGFDSNVKNIVKEFYDKMNMANMDLYGSSSGVNNPSGPMLNNINPHTGSFTPQNIYYTNTNLSEITNPDISSQSGFVADQFLCLNGRGPSGCK